MGEAWARSIHATYLDTNVLVGSSRMLEINERLGFRPYRINLRRRL